jgi:hypothetical protein
LKITTGQKCAIHEDVLKSLAFREGWINAKAKDLIDEPSEFFFGLFEIIYVDVVVDGSLLFDSEIKGYGPENPHILKIRGLNYKTMEIPLAWVRLF